MTIQHKINTDTHKKKVYPIDVFGVKEIGVTKWLDEYYIPIIGKEYEMIYSNIVDTYIETFCANENDELIYWLGISNIRIATLMSREIFEIMRLKKLKESGYHSIIGRKEWEIDEFNSRLNKDIFNSFKYKSPSKKNKFKQYIKLAFYFFKAMSVSLLKNRTMCFNLGNIPDNMKAYISENKLVPAYFYPSLFLKDYKNFKPNKDLSITVNHFVEKVIEKYHILKEEKQFLVNEIDDVFQKSNQYLLKNLKFLNKNKLGTLLAVGLASPLNRTLIAAWKLSGQKVVGFFHGNNYALAVDDILLEQDGLSITSEVIVTSHGHKLLLEELVDRYRHKLKIANISIVKKSNYKEIFKKLQNKNAVKSIKKIMIVGFPMNNIMYAGMSSHHTFSNLKLELDIVRCLKNYGYEVVYKAHPDRFNEVSGIFDGIVDEVSTDSFESVYDKADCILFGYSSSSTFGFSLLTNKPMVLIKTEAVTWSLKTKALLEKRCRIVNAEVNNNDEINFDESELKKAIDNSIDKISYEIVQNYAF